MMANPNSPYEYEVLKQTNEIIIYFMYFLDYMISVFELSIIYNCLSNLFDK